MSGTRKQFLRGLGAIAGLGLVVAACGQAPASPLPDKPGNLLEAKVIAAWGDYYVVAGRVPVSDNMYVAKLHRAKLQDVKFGTPDVTNQLGLDTNVIGYLTEIPTLIDGLYEIDSVESIVADESNISYGGYGKVMSAMQRTVDGEKQIGLNVRLHAYDGAFNPVNLGGNQRIMISESYIQDIFGMSIDQALAKAEDELSQKIILVHGNKPKVAEDYINCFQDPTSLVVLGPADQISFDDPNALEGLDTIQYGFFNPAYLE
ncbi:hypothetical protein A3K72_01990 [Candidatus Woesearchaeota archaeon RBG_13_36_6]|nr:MAG: hypothetical protein A3K72_01990 [Candidatus Woesearchaeota archaeon RBG_13_36_6]